MDTPDLLIRHTTAWADSKGRSLDAELLQQVVSLRLQHDDLAIGTWPPGSAERLLLVTWPAYAPPPPDAERLRTTLDTFWGFLRATGRMAAASATPAELRKEAKRALPKMAGAYDDPARHSQGRVLTDFGRTLGIDLDAAENTEELQGRLAQITAAWNALPTEERRRLMPDPSPKSARGEAFTEMVNQNVGYDDEDAADDRVEPGDVRKSAAAARDSAFVQDCLRLADWVGPRRPVTQRGLLRPAVAREAYQYLDLWPWEREYDAVTYGVMGVPDQARTAEEDALLAQAALHAWKSAGDCLALDRLWYSCEAAGLVDIGSTVATKTGASPDTDEEWRDLALVLLTGLCLRLGWFTIEPLTGLLFMQLQNDPDPVPIDTVRLWWDTQIPEPFRHMSSIGWPERLDKTLFCFADCGLWRIDDDRISLTDLGRDFTIVFLNALESGLLGDDQGMDDPLSDIDDDL